MMDWNVVITTQSKMESRWVMFQVYFYSIQSLVSNDPGIFLQHKLIMCVAVMLPRIQYYHTYRLWWIITNICVHIEVMCLSGKTAHHWRWRSQAQGSLCAGIFQNSLRSPCGIENGYLALFKAGRGRSGATFELFHCRVDFLAPSPNLPLE